MFIFTSDKFVYNSYSVHGSRVYRYTVLADEEQSKAGRKTDADEAETAEMCHVGQKTSFTSNGKYNRMSYGTTGNCHELL